MSHTPTESVRGNEDYYIDRISLNFPQAIFITSLLHTCEEHFNVDDTSDGLYV